MNHSSLSRRTFLKGSAAVGSLAALSSLSFGEWSAKNAYADVVVEETLTPSICNACSSKCGFRASTVDGVLYRLYGMKEHPYSKGTLCARGHGYAQIAYADDRLTHPLRRKEDGEFEVIDWDTAFSEIGEKLVALRDEYGPDSFALIQDPRPSGKNYTKRFINAYGSNNLLTHAAACNLSKKAGLAEAIGKTSFGVDFGDCKMVMFIGRSYGDGIRPSSANSLAKAAARGCHIVLVDPRLNNTTTFTSEWVPIKPGTDIALLLSICHVLIEEDLYDHEFAETQTYGFEEFAEQAKTYTPEWAEEITDVPADRIRTLARQLAEAAPAAAVEGSWRAAFGCAYKNSFDTTRAVTAVNALLGSWGQHGGAILTGKPKLGKIEDPRFKNPPKPESKCIGVKEYPLSKASNSNIAALEGALDGRIKSMMFYNSNAAKGYAQPETWKEGLDKLDLVVVCDVRMSETALLADYVLPECTYIERFELPELIGGKKQFVAIREPVIEKIHPDTKPCDEIFKGLAEACGFGEYFDFTVEEWAQAQCESMDINFDEILENGIVEVTKKDFKFGTPKFKTPTEKYQFKSDAVGKAGLNPVIGYVERLVEPKGDELSLIGGKQSIHSHTMTVNIEPLYEISRQYNMERIWINAQDAADRGIEDGDLVELSSSVKTGQVHAKVTERLKPGTLFLPTHYGCSSPYEKRAYNYGINMQDFIPFVGGEPAVGSSMTQEVAVTIKKVEA